MNIKPIQTFKDLAQNKRSLLVNLSKAQVVDTIIDLAPSTSWVLLYQSIELRGKRAMRTHKLHVDNVAESTHERLKMLMRLTKAELVRIAYSVSDEILRHRYNSPRQLTVRPARPTLKVERSLEIDRSEITKLAQKHKRQQTRAIAKGFVVVKFRKPIKRKVATVATLDWISSFRNLNRELARTND